MLGTYTIFLLPYFTHRRGQYLYNKSFYDVLSRNNNRQQRFKYQNDLILSIQSF